MSLIFFMTVGMLGCCFMVTVLVRRVQDGCDTKAATQTAARAPNPKQRFVAKTGMDRHARCVVPGRRSGTRAPRPLDRYPLQPQRQDFERFVHECIARALVGRPV